MALEVVCNVFGGIDHVFHKFASGNTPLLTGSPGVQLLLTCVRVGATDGDVLVRAAEAAHRVAFEVSQRQEAVVLEQSLADTDFLDVFGPFHRNHGCSLGIHDVHRSKRPTVDFERIEVLYRRIAIARIVGVGLNDRGVFDVVSQQFLNPFARQNVGTALFAGVQLHRHLAGENGRNLGNDLA